MSKNNNRRQVFDPGTIGHMFDRFIELNVISCSWTIDPVDSPDGIYALKEFLLKVLYEGKKYICQLDYKEQANLTDMLVEITEKFYGRQGMYIMFFQQHKGEYVLSVSSISSSYHMAYTYCIYKDGTAQTKHVSEDSFHD